MEHSQTFLSFFFFFPPFSPVLVSQSPISSTTGWLQGGQGTLEGGWP